MKLEDVMTTQEAGERWNVPADSIKQCCLKRYANKQFTDDEARKSGKNWLVTRHGMERLYGEEPKMLKVINCTSNLHQVMGTVETYKEAWEMIYDREMQQSPCIGKWDKAQWEECDMQDEFPDFKWPEGVDYVWTADWIAEVILDPVEYNEEGVRSLIDDLLLSYKIEEID
jgi:hypothetical protein